MNCAAIPDELIESELFGHEKGSFTGASDRQIGKFEQADKGTIFLDEVGDMSLKTQAKVLRVLQEQELERLGSNRVIKVDVRVIAATNKNLEEEIDKGQFREDLFYRLNVVPIHVPALRERRDDIPSLVRHFADLFARDNNFKRKTFTSAAMERLRQMHWRGNIRELRNFVERLMIMSPNEAIDAKDIPESGVVRPEAAPRCRRRRRRPGCTRRHCRSSSRSRSARTSWPDCARMDGTSPRRPRSSTRRAAISTRSWSSIRLRRKRTDSESK